MAETNYNLSEYPHIYDEEIGSDFNDFQQPKRGAHLQCAADKPRQTLPPCCRFPQRAGPRLPARTSPYVRGNTKGTSSRGCPFVCPGQKSRHLCLRARARSSTAASILSLGKVGLSPPSRSSRHDISVWVRLTPTLFLELLYCDKGWHTPCFWFSVPRTEI